MRPSVDAVQHDEHGGVGWEGGRVRDGARGDAFVSVGGPRSSADSGNETGGGRWSTESRANQPVEAHLSTVFGADELTVVLEEEGEHARVADEGLCVRVGAPSRELVRSVEGGASREELGGERAAAVDDERNVALLVLGGDVAEDREVDAGDGGGGGGDGGGGGG